MKLQLEFTRRFLDQVERLPAPVRKWVELRLRQLAANPRHPSLQTHEVRGACGYYADKIFEAYVTKQYRFTWEYGEPGVIVLRNCDDHDACIRDA